jgi:hypothetical protein
MSLTDGDMGEINENDIDDTKKYIMSFPPKTNLVQIDDACLRPIDFEECVFPDDGWLDGDVSIHFHIYVYVNNCAHLTQQFALNYSALLLTFTA